MKPTRPLVRYHGGKWKLADWIIGNFPKHRVYVEPFGGGASVLLKKDRSYAEVYNDLDGEIVNLFKVARDFGSELHRALELTPFSRTEFEESYKSSDDPIESARKTVVRSFMGFGSAAVLGVSTGFRSNSNRSGTTPALDWRNYPFAFSKVIERLQGVVIENRDALKVISQHDSIDTLVYVDPPYVASSRDKGNDYKHEMDDEQHEHLSSVLHACKSSVVLSGYRTVLYDELYKDWLRIDRKAHADGARDRVECLWVSRPAMQMELLESAA